jgi:hypothetical protein
MLITGEMIGTAAISIIVTLVAGYITVRVTLESRIKDLEHEIKLLEPIKSIILQKGREQVERVFRGEEK